MSGGDDDLIDIGHGVRIQYTSWGEHDRAGLIEYHQCAGGSCRNEDGSPGICGGGIMFDLPGIRDAFPRREAWTVDQAEPLTLSPSLQCGCKGCAHHGWIREGQWVPA